MMDVLVFCPWPNGGAELASRGAVEALQGMGLRAALTHRPFAGERARVYCLLGLDPRLAINVRSADPEAAIMLVNHSCWPFLVRGQDWVNWRTCVNWARTDGHAAVCQVTAQRYAEAAEAFGPDGLDVFPAVYPYATLATPAPAADYLLLAHRAREEKNLPAQVAAAALVGRKHGLRLLWTDDELAGARGTGVPEIAATFGLRADRLPWQTPESIRRIAGHAVCGLAASWADCYSQSVMDCLSQGTPVVGGDAHWMLPDCWRVWPDDVEALALAIELVVVDQEAMRREALRAAAAAEQTQRELLKRWVVRWLAE